MEMRNQAIKKILFLEDISIITIAISGMSLLLILTISKNWLLTGERCAEKYML